MKIREKIVRYAFMAILAFASVFFVLMIVAICAAGFRQHLLPLPLCFVSLILAFFAVISFYVARNLWRESFSGSTRSVIAELQKHNLRSFQFFNIAGGYLQRRLRILWVCSIFFFSLAWVAFLLCFICPIPWWIKILMVAGSFYGVYFFRHPYQVGRYGDRMIDAARRLDRQRQLDCLQLLATRLRTFKGDPIGVYILQLLRQESPDA